MFEKAVNWLDGYLTVNPWYDLIIYHKGECIFRHFNGYTDLEKKTAVTGKERFNLYSCSKPITVTLGMMLVERGIIKLEDKLSDYIPEYQNVRVKTDEGTRAAKNPILLKHLFTMTAGFSYDLSCKAITDLKEKSSECSTIEVARALANEPLRFEPGEKYLYSMCHDVLAAVLEVATGEKFEDLANRLIFSPLKMNDTTFLPTKADFESICEQYRYDYNTKRAEKISKNAPYRLGTRHASGGAGCVSTVEDYIKFSEALRKFELVSEDTLKAMTQNHLDENQYSTFLALRPYGYGLGLRCSKTDGDGIVDFGWDGAAGSYLAIVPEHELSIFVAQHILSSPKQQMIHGVTPFVLEEIKKMSK